MATATRRKVKRLTVGPIEGRGPTLSDAKADLQANLLSAVDGSYAPAILRHGEFAAVVFRTPTGWEYQIHDPGRPLDPDGVRDVSATCMLGPIPRKEAIQRAAAHLVGIDPVDYHADAELPSWLTDADARSNILHTRRFHRAYRWARDNHPDGRDNDSSWHQWACWNYRNPQFA